MTLNMPNKKIDAALKKRMDAVIEKINSHRVKPGMSLNKLATAVGIAASSLSGYMQNKYPGNVEKITAAFEDFFELQNQRCGIILDPEFVLTHQAQKIRSFVAMAHAYRTISVIVGDSGLGKTRSLKLYAEKQNVHYIQCNPFMRGKAGFLQRISMAMDLPVAGNQILMFERLAEQASQRGVLFILDDAQTLASKHVENTTVFEVIRALHDAGVGFVICGNGRVKDSVTQTNSEELYQQFAARSRILDLASDFSRNDVRDIVGGVIAGKLKPDEFEFLYQVAIQYYGSLHIVVNMLTLAVNRAKARKIDLSLDLLKDCAKNFVSQIKPQHKTKKRGLHGKEQKPPLPDNQQGDGQKEGPARAQSA